MKMPTLFEGIFLVSTAAVLFLDVFLFTRALLLTTPVKCAIAGTSQIIFSFLFDIFLYGEPFDFLSVIGACFIIAGCLYSLLNTDPKDVVGH